MKNWTDEYSFNVNLKYTFKTEAFKGLCDCVEEIKKNLIVVADKNGIEYPAADYYVSCMAQDLRNRDIFLGELHNLVKVSAAIADAEKE